MRQTAYQNIIDWNRRRGRPRLGAELIGQIDKLRRDAGSIDQTTSFSEFIPIRLVTIVEVYIREMIREIVDHDDKYFSKAEVLTKGSKVDIGFAAHVNKKELSIGDFVAHAVSVSSLRNVLWAMNTLIDGFSQALEQAHERWTEEIEAWPRPLIVNNLPAMMEDLRELFEVRHVLTHELPRARPFDPAAVGRFLDATGTFIEATDWVVIAVLRGSVPRTQTGMNVRAGEDLEKVEADLERTMNDVKLLPEIDRDAADEVQLAWHQFADKAAALEASYVSGGSMYPMVWATAKRALVSERIQQCIRMMDDWPYLF